MVAYNDITGDSIASGANSQKFRDNEDFWSNNAFEKKKKAKLEAERLKKLEEEAQGQDQEYTLRCSVCGPISQNDVEFLDQTVGCTKCGGVEWGDDGITIKPLKEIGDEA